MNTKFWPEIKKKRISKYDNRSLNDYKNFKTLEEKICINTNLQLIPQIEVHLTPRYLKPPINDLF